MRQQELKTLLSLTSEQFNSGEGFVVTQRINLLGTILELPIVIKAAKDNLAAQQKQQQAYMRVNED